MTDSRVSDIESDIEATRQEFSGLIGELQRRRREATDVKLQARRHPGIAGGVAAVMLTVVALLISRRRRRRRRLNDREARRRMLDQALSRMVAHPEKAGGDNRGVLISLALTAGTAFVSTLARRAAQNAVLRRHGGAGTDRARREAA